MFMPALKSTLLLALGPSAIPTASHLLAKPTSDNYTLIEQGTRNTLDWRIWLQMNGKPASFWRDVPTYPDPANPSIVNFVVEIPRWQDGKIEIKRDEPLSMQHRVPFTQLRPIDPIFHDDRNDQVPFVEPVWPHKSYPFLYGSIPQTWESPNFNHSFTGFEGDNDPMDAFDVGLDLGYVGQIKQVKILRALALNDGYETDRKVLVVDVRDPVAALVNSIEDLEAYRPGVAEAYCQWFRTYKIARGDDVIPIVGGGHQNASFSRDVVAESYGFWTELVEGKVDSNEINFNQTSRGGLGSHVEPGTAGEEIGIPSQSHIEPAVQKPARYDQWFYLNDELELIQLPKEP